MSFSGGQDSSLILSAATRYARQHGLPDPIPITWRSRDVAGSDETAWQEAVVAQLGLHDWVRCETGELLDWVGPVAAAVVARHGVRYPPNAHLHEPLAAEASGGSLLTGVAGDQLFGWWRWSRAASVLARRVKPELRDVPRVALAHAPRRLRSAVASRRPRTLNLPWATPAALRELERRVAADAAAEPPTWAARVQWQVALPAMRETVESLDAIGTFHDCRIVHPLLDPSVVGAVGAAGDPHGFARREDALSALFPTLRPRAVATRRDKAVFNDVLSRAASREAAARWAGEGVDPALVDIGALQALWRERVPIRSALILQQFALQQRSELVTPR